MGFDDDRVGGGVSGDNGLGRLAKTASEATLVDEGPDVASSEGAGSKRLFHGVGDETSPALVTIATPRF